MSDLKSINASTGEVMAVVPLQPAREIDAILGRLSAGRATWSKDISQRIERVDRLAAALGSHAAELALLATREMGKPISEARAEVKKCATLCEHYRDHVAEYLAEEEIVTSSGKRGHVFHRPLGTVLGIMPWNYPYWQAFRFIVPTLLSGNTALLKHASNVPQCALAIERVLRTAGIDENVYDGLFVERKRISEIIEDDRVDAVSLTGSEKAGREVAGAAGRALKPVLLELGGCDPYIVFPDADVAKAASVAVDARFQNAGQSCIAAKRFLVHEAVFDEFLERFTSRVKELTVGNPERDETDIGPLAKSSAATTIAEAIDDAVARGARIVVEGGPTGRGSFVAPVVLVGIDSSMRVAREEIFGPVAALRSFGSEDEAIAVANETRFGLGSSIWTSDAERARRVAARIASGMVFVNQMTASSPSVPFGGIKRSGFGRELAADGARAFVNRQSVCTG